MDSKETPGISFTEALCLLRQLIQINGRKKKRINIQTSNWEENERDWLKSATYFKSLVPTWTYLNEHTTRLRNGLWHFQIDRIPALRPLGIAIRVCRILARWFWRQNFPYVCIMYALRRLAITGSSTSNRLAFAKISFLSVTLSFEKWIKERWLSIESRHWGKLNKLETPRESPHEVSEERDRTQNILLRITPQVFNVINPKKYQ